jgi:hypothetical protein
MKVNLLNDGPVTIIIDSKIVKWTWKIAIRRRQLIEHGVRYFNELTNMAQLTEEVGEVARIIARRYGEQSERKR